MRLTMLGKGLRKLGSGFQRLSRWADPPSAPPPPPARLAAHIDRLNRWYAVDGDQTLRLGTLDLTPDAVVFDLGGYDGSFTVEVFARFGCTVFTFEPCRSFFDPMHQRLHHNPHIKLFPFGLAASTRTEHVALNAAGTSMFRPGEQTEPIELVRAADFFDGERVDRVDLLKVNIEGGEYELLDHLIETGLIRRVKDVQVQFHEDVLPDADRRMRAIQTELAKTHTLLWQHEWIWEHWRRAE